VAPFALAALFYLASPSHIAHQDLGSLLAQQTGVAERARTFFFSSSLASLRTATFTPTRPLGSMIPAFRVHFDPDITGSINSTTGTVSRSIGAFDWTGFDVTGEEEVFQLPTVNRAKKGDLLRLRPVALPPADKIAPPVPVAVTALPAPDLRLEPNPAFDIAVTVAPAAPEAAELATRAEPNPAFDIAAPLAAEAAMVADATEPRADVAGSLADPADAGKLPSWSIYRVSRLLFGTDEGILPPSAFEHRAPVKLAALPNAADTMSEVQKGIITGDDRRPLSPAGRLNLIGAKRAKAEKCLANAIYFESRGETKQGQIAVAQVVVNRTFSGYYPEDVCGVVYQNAHRHLACQFTFACDGIPDVVNEPEMWEQAKQIARDMLDGKLWLAEVGKATHYHAYWVRPAWVREMRKIQRIGVHTFYRPRKWEDG
jgi:hypothetical protein